MQERIVTGRTEQMWRDAQEVWHFNEPALTFSAEHLAQIVSARSTRNQDTLATDRDSRDTQPSLPVASCSPDKSQNAE
jgi:hypothetical protein